MCWLQESLRRLPCLKTLGCEEGELGSRAREIQGGTAGYHDAYNANE